MSKTHHNYGTAMLAGFDYLLETYPEVFVIGQGLWSPWYVGNSMTDLDKMFGAHRVIDTPVSESACTGAAVGAALAGMKPIIVHPRMDFMLYAMDAIVNQAAKWSHMVGGQAAPALTVRSIINRGGEQGAQHSQALQSWFAHVPGLRVVMPASVADARDLLIASVLCPDPVIFIDDRWLYDLEDDLPPVIERALSLEGPRCIQQGVDITLVASSYSTRLALDSLKALNQLGISAEVIDLRVINPLDPTIIINSVKKTGRLLAIDGGWSPCGMAGEVIASVIENVSPKVFKKSPQRITLPFAPAPTASLLEEIYYPTVDTIVSQVKKLMD
ncbi:alpha-ketoacid dehydrogenase subunit beta [Polynucleobacter necessarius]|uniref:alpha-ketoacid dehydrogenase subunit beta n=1 Tax=Polynucleobacter necessarius TaxID=576610 RepID=UPI000FE1E0A1|nr:transketolase C-terminal domain-containing protein [Polynucleobacter necessarius]